MIRTLILSVFLSTFLSVIADRKEEYNRIREFLLQNNIRIEENKDTIVDWNGYSIKIIQGKDSISHFGLDLFNPELKQVLYNGLLDFIERDLLLQTISEKDRDDSVILFRVGDLSDLKQINSDTPCDISTVDSSLLLLDWTTKDGRHILISTPISYDLILGGSRTEIENAFISKVKQSNAHRNIDIEIDPKYLQPYRESEYILPGENYINENITRNIYLSSDKDSSLIWNNAYPLESISNLFICGASEGNIDVDLTVIKHDYGESEQLITNIENLIAVAEIEGCVPYWGLESFENGKITGSLFLFNPELMYDHVLRIECIPEEIMAGEGAIVAKAYLYIPTNNVRNLNEPYRVKTEDEKINYREY